MPGWLHDWYSFWLDFWTAHPCLFWGVIIIAVLARFGLWKMGRK